MRNKGYTVLGVFVWKTVKFYVKMNYGKYIPSRRQALIGAVVLAALGAGAAGAVARQGDGQLTP